MDVRNTNLIEIRDQIAQKKVSAVEVVSQFLKISEKLNPSTKAYITINPKVVDEARAIDQSIAGGKPLGPLAGVPVAIKDMLCTEGVLTTAGSKILSNYVPPFSATVVQRLKNAGAVIIGKTNCDEFAMGSSTETSAFGRTRNPWNLDYVPGGSSGGAAAVIAARMAAGSIGTDTGGSIRQPANFCGTVGIKPTYGRVSRYGIVAFASSLDQAGPMTHTVKDAALMLQVIAGHDSYDSTTTKLPAPKWSEQIRPEVKGLKIGLPKEYFVGDIDGEVQKTVDEVIARLKKQGAELVEVTLPYTKLAVPIYYLIATSEASSNLARYDGIRYGHRAADPAASKDLETLYKKTRGEGFGSEVKRRIMLGTFALSSGYYDAYYLKACQIRRKIRDSYMEAFKKCDILLSPVCTTPAFKIGERIEDPLAMYLNDIYTTPTNLAGLPGMSVPAGFNSLGLPLGVQLTAKHFDEQTLFNVGQAIENSYTTTTPRIPDVSQRI